MPPSVASAGLHVFRPVDLSRVDAVGFDLDHTLALYDDHALNLLAAGETVDLLPSRLGMAVQRVTGARMDPIPPVRTMALDLRHGAVLKLDGENRVRAARRAYRWLTGDEITGHFPRADDPALISAVHSPFDIPVVWLYEHLAATARDHELPSLVRDIRSLLDWVHTEGDLKPRIARELDRFVSPAGDTPQLLREWRGAGKKLFVVTNSHREYAGLVLDRVVGTDWAAVFDAVVVDARKPAFFRGAGEGPSDDGSTLMDGASALEVERRLGARGQRILYLGDNLPADVVAARAFGWQAGAVVPELAVASAPSPWGELLHHDGDPTWYAATLAEHAVLACDRVDRLLRVPAGATLETQAVFPASDGSGDTP